MELSRNITVIPARKRVGNTAAAEQRPKLKVAAYCRVSTDSEEQASSYEVQVAHYTQFIQKNPEWELAGIYADDGITGTNTKKREEFNRMIQDCMDGNIDMIITKSISRFARNTLDCLKYIRELKEKNIEIVLNFHAQPVMIIADAQKTSRIVENLFSNLRKYALEGTRVYIDVNGGDNFGTLIFRNISKFPLNIAPEELTQRFVRGDASRSGEGSGLGLSIANDLCELQGGKFSIAIDGDLFKVSIAMPKAQ